MNQSHRIIQIGDTAYGKIRGQNRADKYIDLGYCESCSRRHYKPSYFFKPRMPEYIMLRVLLSSKKHIPASEKRRHLKYKLHETADHNTYRDCNNRIMQPVCQYQYAYYVGDVKNSGSEGRDKENPSRIERPHGK